MADQQGQLTFYVNDASPDHEGVSFGSTHRTAGDPRQFGADRALIPGALASPREVNVTTIDFPRFLTLLDERRAPAAGKVVIKMDIEGGEYSVLPAMVARGVLCAHVDHLTAEFHPRFAPLGIPGRELQLTTSDEAAAFASQLTALVADSGAHCRTRAIDQLDDEAYPSDRSPKQRHDPSVQGRQ